MSFNNPAIHVLYALSLHDALPILDLAVAVIIGAAFTQVVTALTDSVLMPLISALVGSPNFDEFAKVTLNGNERSEEHTSELQSRGQLVCRLLLEKTNDHANVGCRS